MEDELYKIPYSIQLYGHKYNEYEPITEERLRNYRYIVLEYLQLLEDKNNLINKISSLKGINYDRIKVQTGNGPKITEEEQYTINLEKVNHAIREYQGWLPDEQQIIKNQLFRLKKPLYSEILIAYYINGKKWSVILQEKLGTRVDFKDNYQNYHKTLMEWRKSALKQLEEISSKPYVPVIDRQLTMKL